MATDEQKQLLQYLLYQPMVSVDEFKKIYATIFEKSIETNEMKILVRTLNDLLKPVAMAIKYRLCEDSNKETFVLMSLTETAAAKQHISEFTVPELDLLKCIMKEILSSETGTVSSIDCINYSITIAKLTKSDAQKALEKFISSQWLKEREGEVSFTVRTLLELEPLLKKLDPELGDCKICGFLVVKGVVCPNGNCATKVHRFCWSKLSQGAPNYKCPMCQKPWPATLDDSSSAASSSRSQSPSQNTSTNGARRKTTKRVIQSSESDDSN